jgi:DNA-binding Lrp family transcriptional regulator
VSAEPTPAPAGLADLDDLDRRLLDGHQCGLPLVPRPFAALADSLGCSESEVIARLGRLAELGAVARVGPVFRPNRVGASTLAAIAVPPERLAAVAALVNGYSEVNHNYEREHRFNLWFVLTAPDRGALGRVIEEIARRTGLEVLDLPLLAEYHIDLGFPLQWS